MEVLVNKDFDRAKVVLEKISKIFRDESHQGSWGILSSKGKQTPIRPIKFNRNVRIIAMDKGLAKLLNDSSTYKDEICGDGELTILMFEKLALVQVDGFTEGVRFVFYNKTFVTLKRFMELQKGE